MNGKIIKKYVLVDTSFWIALYDRSDQYHSKAVNIYPELKKFCVMIPWPILYEVLRTKFIKQKLWVEQFNKDLKIFSVRLIEDTPYKIRALNEIFKIYKRRNLSLVDMVSRYILMDSNLKINYLVTFNKKDFIDVCKERKIIIYDGG